MRATLNIPDELISEVQKATGEKSKTKAIVIAMEEYIKDKKIRGLLALRGKVKIKDVTRELDALELKEQAENDKRWRSR